MQDVVNYELVPTDLFLTINNSDNNVARKRIVGLRYFPDELKKWYCVHSFSRAIIASENRSNYETT